MHWKYIKQVIMFSQLIRDVLYSLRQHGCFSAWDAGKKTSCIFLTVHPLINSVVRFSGTEMAHGCCTVTSNIYLSLIRRLGQLRWGPEQPCLVDDISAHAGV